MNEIDLKIFNDQMSGAFPFWEPTQYENQIWAEKLNKLELWQAQEALQRYFENMSMTESKGKPTMSKFLGYVPKRKQEKEDFQDKGITLVRRNKGENSFWVQPVHFKKGETDQQMYDRGTAKQWRYSEMYGGKWYLFCEILKPAEAKKMVEQIESGEMRESQELEPIIQDDRDYFEDVPW